MPTSDPLVFVRYLDVWIVVLAAPFVVLMGGPMLGYVVGGAVWIATRVLGIFVDRYARTRSAKAQVGITFAALMGRAWILGITILAVGLAGEREDGSDGGAARARRVHGLPGHDPGLAPHGEELAQLMTRASKILIWTLLGYVVLTAAAFLVFGSAGRNEDFAPQDEFTLYTWIDLPGSLDINKAVLYLVLSGILTIGTMLYVSKRMQARPNRIQTAVEVLFGLMRDNITKGNMDDKMAAKYFPFIGTLFLFIWFNNLIGFIPLPTAHEKFNLFGLEIPTFGIYAATANVSVPLVLALIVFISYTSEGIRAKGVGGYLKSLIPSGVHRPDGRASSSSSSCCRTSCGSSRSPFDFSPTCSPAT